MPWSGLSLWSGFFLWQEVQELVARLSFVLRLSLAAGSDTHVSELWVRMPFDSKVQVHKCPMYFTVFDVLSHLKHPAKKPVVVEAHRFRVNKHHERIEGTGMCRGRIAFWLLEPSLLGEVRSEVGTCSYQMHSVRFTRAVILEKAKWPLQACYISKPGLCFRSGRASELEKPISHHNTRLVDRRVWVCTVATPSHILPVSGDHLFNQVAVFTMPTLALTRHHGGDGMGTCEPVVIQHVHETADDDRSL